MSNRSHALLVCLSALASLLLASFAAGCNPLAPADLAAPAPTADAPSAGPDPAPANPGTAPGPATPPSNGTPSTGSGTPSAGSGGGMLSNCPSCRVHVPPGYNASKPAPLLVALHGDEGRDLGLDAATSMAIGLWSAAADAHGYIVLAVACPSALGCDGAFSDWLAADGYDLSPAALAWLDQQVDELEHRYNLDRSREYLGGTSGGAYWLGGYAPARAQRYAGVAFVAGGMPAYQSFHGCPSFKQPAYFLGGDLDPRTGGQMSDTGSAYMGCGSRIELDLVKGAGHEATIGSLGSGRADAILTWFKALPLGCQ